jgi:hypothetical protein
LEKNYSPLDFILVLAAALMLGCLAFFVGCQLSDPDRVIASLERFFWRARDDIQPFVVWRLGDSRRMVFFFIVGCGGFLKGNYPWLPFVAFMILETTYLSALHWAQDRLCRWYNSQIEKERDDALWVLPVNKTDPVAANDSIYPSPFVILTHSQPIWAIASALFHCSWDFLKLVIKLRSDAVKMTSG